MRWTRKNTIDIMKTNLRKERIIYVSEIDRSYLCISV